MNGRQPWIRQLNSNLFRRPWQKSIKTAKLSKKQQVRFFLLLVDLLTGGFSLREALQFMTTVMPESKLILVEVSRSVQEGKCLADSLKQYLKSDLYYQLLLAEQHGNLITTLTEVGRLMQAQERQRHGASASRTSLGRGLRRLFKRHSVSVHAGSQYRHF